MGDVAVEAGVGYVVVGLRNRFVSFFAECCPTEGCFGRYFHIVFEIGVAVGECEVAVNRHFGAYDYGVGGYFYRSGVDFV